MDAATERNYQIVLPKRYAVTSSSELGSKQRKRIKSDGGGGYADSSFSSSWRFDLDRKRNTTCADHSDPFTLHNLVNELHSGKYGSVTKDIQEFIMRRRQLLDSIYAINPELSSACFDVPNEVQPKTTELVPLDVIDIDDEQDDSKFSETRSALQSHYTTPVVLIDSDDDTDTRTDNHRYHYSELNLKNSSDNLLMKDVLEQNQMKPSKTLLMKDVLEQNQMKPSKTLLMKNVLEQNQMKPSKTLLMKDFVEQNFSQSQNSPRGGLIDGETESTEDKGVYVGTDDDTQEDELSETNSDGLGNIWNEMTVALECSKEASEDALLDEYEGEDEEDCEHSFILKDDIGDVCRICGVIGRGIESIIEYNFSKGTKNTRTYRYEGRAFKDVDQTDIALDGFKSSDIDFNAAEIYPHPRHRKEMKPHQVEGFNFLLSNLVSDNPGGCIMAHAPGSGKTFMIISFLQSFMAKFPNARPLVVLPRGILGIWKKEFLRWQVENIPLYDFYSVKADSRPQQLEVLKEWMKERSILFLGYKQFSSIVCDTDDGNAAVACQSYLLKIPSILILDEGHTPRNSDTDILTSLERVETTRKVVLSGTLYQNHVREVFNILNLVRPKFLKLETPKAIKRRILSRAEISGRKNLLNTGFYDLIEHTLIKDENDKRKATVIQDLREMTKRVLHYYKGDNLDELPGLVDFSVFLQLSPRQKADIKELTKTKNRKFTISAQGSAIYVHPSLKALAQNSGVKDRVDEEKIDAVLEKLNVKEGAKLNFYLNLLQLCESGGEKLLVFSQYLLPLKFLERITAKVKGYMIGKEMFMITGDSDAETRESSMEKFNVSSEARVFFGSIKACGEGISLVGASRIIILDVHLNPSVTRQAIGRAFRPGQVRKVYTYRLVASGAPEEEDHTTCFKKETIAKLWFEWDENSGPQLFNMETVDVKECGDMFLETSRLHENVVSLFKR